MTRPGSSNLLETLTTLEPLSVVLAMDRIKRLASQFSSGTARSLLEAKSLEDVVITLAIRSPMCKVSRLLAFVQRT